MNTEHDNNQEEIDAQMEHRVALLREQGFQVEYSPKWRIAHWAEINEQNGEVIPCRMFVDWQDEIYTQRLNERNQDWICR